MFESTNPFDDKFIISSLNKSESNNTVEPHKTYTVPQVKGMPTSSSSISIVTNSTTVTTPTPPIQWTQSTLYTLIWTLFPGEPLGTALIMEHHHHHNHQAIFPHTTLSLYRRTSAAPIPAAAYSATAPIGTGRPLADSKTLLAQGEGASLPAAMHALATALLRAEPREVAQMAACYRFLAGLYALPGWALRSVRRAILRMGQVTRREWEERLVGMRGAGVGEGWDFEARLEKHLLESGWWELGDWVGSVEEALKLEGDGRKERVKRYREAEWFLRAAALSV